MRNKLFFSCLLLIPLTSCNMNGFFDGGSGKVESIDVSLVDVFNADGDAHIRFISDTNPFAYKDYKYEYLLVNEEVPLTLSYDTNKINKGYFNIRLENYDAKEYTFTWYTLNNKPYLEGSTRSLSKYTPIKPVEQVELETITVTNPKTDYFVGDTFEKPMVVAHYSDDSTKDVTDEAEFTGYDLNQAGSYTVYVSYQGKLTGYTITVKNKEVPVTLTSLEVKNQTSEFTVGDDYVKPTVIAHYSKGTSYDVSDLALFYGYDMSTAGTYNVTVSYGGITTQYQITVKAKDAIVYPDGYTQLIWQDEFNGSSVDGSKWDYDLGDGSQIGVWQWGNNEQQYYKPQNATTSNGKLHITAKREQVGDYKYTSCRMVTRGKFSFKYGYIEAMISLPEIQGMWPAFWMLPEDNVYGGWPHSGEIDIMEAKGRFPNNSSSALHFSNNGHKYISNERQFTNGTMSSYHKYACEWTSEYIRFLVDGVEHLRINKDSWNTDNPAHFNGKNASSPFDKNFHILLNLAVGGKFDDGRLPPDNFQSCEMNVEYVRVFQK